MRNLKIMIAAAIVAVSSTAAFAGGSFRSHHGNAFATPNFYNDSPGAFAKQHRGNLQDSIVLTSRGYQSRSYNPYGGYSQYGYGGYSSYANYGGGYYGGYYGGHHHGFHHGRHR